MNIKKLFPKKIKEVVAGMFGYVDSGTIYMNNHVDIVHKACRICIGKEPLTDYDSQLNNIRMVVSRGHESVLEHSNIIMYLTVPLKEIQSLLQVTEHFKYLNYKTVMEDKNIKVLIGGSIRGYKHVFRFIKNQNNVVLESIKQELYVASNKEYFMDFIEAGIMDYNQFKREPFAEVDDNGDLIEDTEENIVYGKFHHTFEIMGMDDISKIYKIVSDLGGFTYDDLLDLCTVTILFKNMSRIITQQMTRHRAAITQESQRYVDYSTAKFIDPMQFKPDKYDINKKYEIQLENNITYDKTTKQLAESNISLYKQLREQGLDKEDARGFLFQNFESKLIMTFTFRGLIKFLELREDVAAQPEIRSTAIPLGQWFRNVVEPIIGDIYKYLLPKYTLQEAEYDYDTVDEAMGDVETSLDEIDNKLEELQVAARDYSDTRKDDDEESKDLPNDELIDKRLEKF